MKYVSWNFAALKGNVNISKCQTQRVINQNNNWVLRGLFFDDDDNNNNKRERKYNQEGGNSILLIVRM